MTHKGFTGRRWIRPRFVIAHEGRMVWLRLPGGLARLGYRHRVRSVTNDSRPVLELKERAARRMTWPQDRHLQGVKMERGFLVIFEKELSAFSRIRNK